MQIIKICAFASTAALGLLLHCNNYDLLKKLEDPGGSSGGAVERFTTNYYVFVSSWLTQGDMSGQPYAECNSDTGAARADCACTRAAAANGLRRNGSHLFRAYLANFSGGIEARCQVAGLPSGCNPNTGGPWFNTQGALVFNGLADLTGGLTNPIKFTEAKVDIASGFVWTGNGASGNVMNACDAAGSWNDTTTTNVAVGDLLMTVTQWQAKSNLNCNTLNRIYCMATP